eukprot:Tbor_TRINITY_DN5966_c3_g1::TRINITY_DN5966_c3_g1_i1::g.18348::m.18348/K19683/TTC30, DYF1; tetratricopeptide repeat protein 30
MHTAYGRPMTTMGLGTLERIEQQIQEGNFTSVIYSMIRDQKYEEVIDILSLQLDEFPRSRAAISMIAYCYYHMGDYDGAARMYEQLVKICPGVEEYSIYYAQSMYKAGLYTEAQKIVSLIDSEQNDQQLKILQASIAYEQDELHQTKGLLEKCVEDRDGSVTSLSGCVMYREGDYLGALNKFREAETTLGSKLYLEYNIAVCHYKLQQYGMALERIGKIIEKGIQDHPGLNIGSNGSDARSVGNTQGLKDTLLIEAFNLKAAIEYMLKNYPSAKEALADMPPRSEEELDPVTLHNSALMNMSDDPTRGFKKFNYLIQTPPFPPETFQNLLLFFCKYQYFDLAADVLAENTHLSYKYLSMKNQPLYDFLDGLITAQTSPEEAYCKFDLLSNKHIDQLRKYTKKIQDAKQKHDKDGVKAALKAYDESLEEYIPVLMAQAKIYWDIENYPMVEKLFRSCSEFCSEHESWKLNVAHAFFMQETKFTQAIRYYEPVVDAHSENILNCSAIVLANLCVSYIMASMNDKAEEVMRRLEREEERMMSKDPDKQPLHLCIVNLVLGTLYCSKGNFEFGISRIIKSLEPYSRKIMSDTWFYAKRCFLALALSLAKHMVLLKDATFTEILAFFDQADIHGGKIAAHVHPDPAQQDTSQRNTVRWEARQLKKLYLSLQE